MLAAVALVLGGAAVPAYAEPGEGGSKKLQDALELTAKGHIEAKAKLDNSKRRQTALTGELTTLEGRLVGLSSQVGEVAAQSYRVGRLSAVVDAAQHRIAGGVPATRAATST